MQVLGALEVGRINVAARAVGVAQASFDHARAYSQQRQAFGQPISGFQAVQHKLADMATEIQAARLLTWWAAWQADRRERADTETGMAKLFASEVGNWVTDKAIQIHGGYGYVQEYLVERYLRDAKITEIYEGTSEIQRIVISRDLLKE